MSPLRWTCKSTTQLAAGIDAPGPSGQRAHGGASAAASRATACRATARPRRAARTRIAMPSSSTSTPASKRFQQRGQPVISVDTKKKELVGRSRTAGREWQPKGEPEEVRVHDFLDQELGKAIPYGVYDLSENQGWVSVGIDHDTAQLRRRGDPPLVEEDGMPSAIRDAAELLITADGGGSNGSRCRLWKVALQDLATKLGLRRSRSATSRRARASGTRSSIACSATSPRTGAADRWSATKSSST